MITYKMRFHSGIGRCLSVNPGLRTRTSKILKNGLDLVNQVFDDRTMTSTLVGINI